MFPRTIAPGLLTLQLVAGLTAQALSVTAVSPPNQSHADAATAITVTFDQPINPAAVTAATVRVHGKWSGALVGQLSVDGSATSVTFQPDRPYFPAETVTIMLSNAVLASNGDPLTGGFTSTFWVRPLAGSGSFAIRKIMPMRRIAEGPTRTFDVFAGDLDRDGSPDIAAVNEQSGDIRVLHNDGCGRFGPMTVHSMPGQRPNPQAGCDLDGDGWLDLVTGNSGGTSISVLLSDGAGGFGVPETLGTGGFTHGIACLDADGDGDTDVVAPNRDSLLVFLNDGTGSLGLASAIDSGTGEDNVAVADADGDGIADLFVGNHDGAEVALLLGDGAGGFAVSSTLGCGGSPWCIAAGDVNGDGFADAVTANRADDNVGLVFGDGSGNLTSSSVFSTGLTPSSIDLADVDGDGDLDVVVAATASRNYAIHWNDGAGNFSAPVTLFATSAGSGCALVDFDRDGDVDVIAADDVADEIRLYVQNGPAVPAQPPTCEATLRVNHFAGRSGLGISPAQSVRLDSIMHLGVTGAPNSPFAILIGTARSQPLPIIFGLWHLDALQLVLPVVNGYAGDSQGVTDAFGEANYKLAIPANLPAGIPVTFQGLVRDWTALAGNTLTNPQVVEFH